MNNAGMMKDRNVRWGRNSASPLLKKRSSLVGLLLLAEDVSR